MWGRDDDGWFGGGGTSVSVGEGWWWAGSEEVGQGKREEGSDNLGARR